jgi:hypothetical protein
LRCDQGQNNEQAENREGNAPALIRQELQQVAVDSWFELMWAALGSAPSIWHTHVSYF